MAAVKDAKARRATRETFQKLTTRLEFKGDGDDRRVQARQEFLTQGYSLLVKQVLGDVRQEYEWSNDDTLQLFDATSKLILVACPDATLCRDMVSAGLPALLVNVLELIANGAFDKANPQPIREAAMMVAQFCVYAEPSARPELVKLRFVEQFYKLSSSVDIAMRGSAYRGLAALLEDDGAWKLCTQFRVAQNALKVLNDVQTNWAPHYYTALCVVKWHLVGIADHWNTKGASERSDSGQSGDNGEAVVSLAALLRSTNKGVTMVMLKAILNLPMLQNAEHDFSSLLVTAEAVPAIISLLSSGVSENAVLRYSTVLIAQNAVASEQFSVQVMLHGGLGPLLQLIQHADKDVRTGAIQAFMGLTATRTVCAIGSSLLSSSSSQLQGLVTQIVANTPWDATFHAAASIAFLALEEQNIVALTSSGALQALQKYVQSADPLYENPQEMLYVSNNGFKSYLRMLSSKRPAVLGFFAFLCARLSLPRMSGFMGTMHSEWIKGHLIDQLRAMSRHVDPSVRRHAATALRHLQDTDYLVTQSTKAWVESINLRDTSGVIKLLEKQDVDIELLLSLPPDQVAAMLRELSLTPGAQYRMLLSLQTIAAVDAEASKKAAELISAVTTTHPRSISVSPSEGVLPPSADAKEKNRAQVFISYSWSNKASAKQVFSAITQRGVSCWMDTSQLHGGSALWADIESAITNAKIIVCCVSNDYVRSRACQKEVSLADDRVKIIVPIIVQSIADWPPRGVMGPMFSGRIYVDIGTDDKLVKALPDVVTAVEQSLGDAL